MARETAHEFIRSRRGMDVDPKTILVVDDDRTMRRLLLKILTSRGFRVEEAERGEKCLFLAMERDFDGFIIDISMPGLSGLELCRRLRSMPKYRMTPIICVTASGERGMIGQAFDAGVDDFIEKPVDPVTLHARLSGHLQKMDYFSEMERVRENLKRYVSSRTQRMVEAYSVTGYLPPPEQHHVCILFSDVRGFTALSQELDPNTLFRLLSRQLGRQVDLVYRFGGYIDKFAGDGIMAIFDGEDEVARACRCAVEMVRSGREAELADTRLFRLGIGIHYGQVLIGNIGSREHLDYSAVGETVNLAARLCGCAEPSTVVVSSTVAERAGSVAPELEFGHRRAVEVRGIREPVTVFELNGLEDD